MNQPDPAPAAPAAETARNDFIRQIVREDLASGKHTAIRTRFPPEPNGYLHIGHAKAICLDFGIAEEFGGTCNLRFDDTNPAKEDPAFVRAIQEDVLAELQWAELRHASDYFEVFYLAAKLIRQGDAFVCDLSPEEVRQYRGTLTEPGRNSPFRDRSVERTWTCSVARAPAVPRRRAPCRQDRHGQRQHARPGPVRISTYAIAGAAGASTRCTTSPTPRGPIEASPIRCAPWSSDHRPLRDWCVDKVDLAGNPELLGCAEGYPIVAYKPPESVLAMNINYAVMSKRKLTQLVAEGLVDGWDDPRMYTLQGLRRRGYTPSALRLFVDRIGVSKQNSVIDFSVLEGALREDLDTAAPRRMAVIEPLRLVLANLPEGHEETLVFANHPKDESFGSRQVPFSRELWIERDDFARSRPRS